MLLGHSMSVFALGDVTPNQGSMQKLMLQMSSRQPTSAQTNKGSSVHS